MNRTVAKRNAAGTVPAAAMSARSRHARRALHRPRGSTTVVHGFVHAVGLPWRQLRAAYPFVAALVQTLAAAPPKFGRRHAHHLPPPHAARA